MGCFLILTRLFLPSDLFQTLRTAVQPGPDFKQAVAVLPSHNFEVSASFRELVQTKFGGYIPSVRYTDQADAISTINRWAQDQTGDHIQEVVTALDAQTQLLLATVSYYQSESRRGFTCRGRGLAVLQVLPRHQLPIRSTSTTTVKNDGCLLTFFQPSSVHSSTRPSLSMSVSM